MELTVPVEGGHLWADDTVHPAAPPSAWRSPTRAVTAPAIVVTGDREYSMVARCAAEIAARIPGCQQVPAPGADHMLPLRAPDLIAALAAKLAG